jgi:predicted nuclease of restriction endonuclease-like (RecB) superfamily
MAGLDRKVKKHRRQNKQAEKRAAEAAKKRERKSRTRWATRTNLEAIGALYERPAISTDYCPG